MQPTKNAVGKTDQRNVITGDFPQIRRGRLRNVAKTLFADCRHYQVICHPELAIFYGLGRENLSLAPAEETKKHRLRGRNCLSFVSPNCCKRSQKPITQQCHSAVTGLF
jgi:hypothetical protein